jgi:phenylalanyl-tRNA synthetase alpha chain
MTLSEYMAQLETLEREARESLAHAVTPEAVASAKNAFLGRKGRLRDLMTALGSLPAGDRQAGGKKANEIKAALEAAFEAVQRRMGVAGPAAPAPRREDRHHDDLTRPGVRPPVGRLHPVYETLASIRESFLRLGFEVFHGPELEEPYNNFEALNIPSDHPSAEAFDTYYIQRPNSDGRGGLLLRSHTSPCQAHYLRDHPPPFRVIVPGKVFRPDTPDASHAPMFHQVEGLVVDRGVSFAHLKGILLLFCRQQFGPETRLKFRASFFPFTEPSAEVDVSCILCAGKGCAVCGQSGWIEILGAGMVHPAVFARAAKDSARRDVELAWKNSGEFTGFAFGMGVERIAMLRHRIPDIRLLTGTQPPRLDHPAGDDSRVSSRPSGRGRPSPPAARFGRVPTGAPRTAMETA